MACGRRLAGNECDLIAIVLAEHADPVQYAAFIEMHHEHLLLGRVRLEKRLADAHLADVIPDVVVECGFA